jgi:uncharacterized damage-inducible protein DinB
MKEESTISKINSELIRTFSSLDAWFDKALDDGYEDDDEWSMREVLQHLVNSNYHLLDFLSDGYDYALSEYDHVNRSGVQKSFHAIRYALREQLFQCLCLLDNLEQSGNLDLDDEKEMNVYDKLWAITNHLSYHLEQLEVQR